jgi:hypothetical protein
VTALVSGKKRPYAFGGHEKFVFRQSWLKKGFDLACSEPTIFTQNDALVRLGVGKNMVRSIRYWCLALGLLEDHPDGPKAGLRPTPLGERLLSNGGWDPYLENTATLWLLHWQLVFRKQHSLIWHYVFTTFLDREFTRQRLAEFVERQLDREGFHTTPQMVEREVDVCLRTYVPAQAGRSLSFEDSLNCPLAELGLIRSTPEERLFSFAIGPKPLLPAEVFGYALFLYLEQFAAQQRTVAVDELLYRPGSPGQAFKLDENSVVVYLEALEGLTDGQIGLHETAGIRQLYLRDWRSEPVMERALELLHAYYE